MNGKLFFSLQNEYSPTFEGEGYLADALEFQILRMSKIDPVSLIIAQSGWLTYQFTPRGEYSTVAHMKVG